MAKTQVINTVINAGLERAYADFENRYRAIYADNATTRHKLSAVRHFCDFLANDRPPRAGDSRWPEQTTD